MTALAHQLQPLAEHCFLNKSHNLYNYVERKQQLSAIKMGSIDLTGLILSNFILYSSGKTIQFNVHVHSSSLRACSARPSTSS